MPPHQLLTRSLKLESLLSLAASVSGYGGGGAAGSGGVYDNAVRNAIY